MQWFPSTHYYLWMLQWPCSQSCTCYPLLGASPARQKSTDGNRQFHHPRFPVILVKDTLLLCLGVAMHVSVIFFLIKILQMLVAASLLDCYINLKHFLPKSLLVLKDNFPQWHLIISHTHTHTHGHTRMHTQVHTQFVCSVQISLYQSVPQTKC